MTIYNQYRPQKFSEIVGQDRIITCLKAQSMKNQYHHSYFFYGDSGTGKTSTARILAAVMNCHTPAGGEPCGVCQSCTATRKGSHWDLIEVDGARYRGIDAMESLCQKAYYSPFGSKKKIIIIDEAHQLTDPAWNALLKLLEEPPDTLVIILCTTRYQSIPQTIVSRCQRYEFLPLELEPLEKILTEITIRENKILPQPTIRYIAGLACGNVRMAQNALEQAMVLAN